MPPRSEVGSVPLAGRAHTTLANVWFLSGMGARGLLYHGLLVTSCRPFYFLPSDRGLPSYRPTVLPSYRSILAALLPSDRSSYRPDPRHSLRRSVHHPTVLRSTILPSYCLAFLTRNAHN